MLMHCGVWIWLKTWDAPGNVLCVIWSVRQYAVSCMWCACTSCTWCSCTSCTWCSSTMCTWCSSTMCTWCAQNELWARSTLCGAALPCSWPFPIRMQRSLPRFPIQPNPPPQHQARSFLLCECCCSRAVLILCSSICHLCWQLSMVECRLFQMGISMFLEQFPSISMIIVV